jgi:hypothetical protein
MRVTDTVRRIVTACKGVKAWMIRRPRRGRAGQWRHRPITARLTVAQWMWAKGVSGPDIARWGSAVGTVTARLARRAGYRPVKVFTVSAGGMYPEYVYPDATFMELAWVTPDAKGRTYVDKMNIGG